MKLHGVRVRERERETTLQESAARMECEACSWLQTDQANVIARKDAKAVSVRAGTVNLGWKGSRAI